MAIDRLRAAYASSIVVSNVTPGQAAYADGTGQSVTPYTFVGDGTAGTVNGATYRVHRFEDAGGATESITFSQAGSIDLLVVAGGAAGGGAYLPNNSSNGYAGGGGGAGGLILLYNLSVDATSYSASVGIGGYGVAGSTGMPASSYAGDSTFGAYTAVRGGMGARAYSTNNPQSGGSGGGVASGATNGTTIASGTSGQGNAGGSRGAYIASTTGAGGGGGYSQAGGAGGPDLVGGTQKGGDGGDGVELRFDGVLRGFAGGGGGGLGGSNSGNPGAGGTGGGGNGGDTGSLGGDATGFGCGGGGAGYSTSSVNPAGGDGSHGLILVRYRIG